jgi:hypothetical protein
MRAQTQVEAILHRLRLPLAAAEGRAPGQVVPLPGVTVASVRLASAGLDLGPARLGQVAGMRAVRIETPLAPELVALGQPGLTLGHDPDVPSGGPGPDGAERLAPDAPWSLPASEEAPVWGPPEVG